MSASRTVHLIQDPLFGNKLATIPVFDAVWILDSVENRYAVAELRKASLRQFTLFQVQAMDDLLYMIELHHGVDSQTPAFQQLIIWGYKPEESLLRACLESIDFQLVESKQNYIRAHRRA
ncbi:hypothetical protein LRS06_14660 [Hymenobacter sp. J193]|uniref:hypothetical protein n=1 Tax=Hymenobacter sp. J193 TaxID=2898429 RepID=UPI00215159F1|nr:hypothetical protein [Hymenobacter sp. J193]MCR5888986.1 hypothetical protein [Hymenobacter sp. J193]